MAYLFRMGMLALEDYARALAETYVSFLMCSQKITVLIKIYARALLATVTTLRGIAVQV